MGVHSIDQIILSCNEDSTYSEFWGPVSWAYKKMLPGVKVHLAFLTWRDESDPLIELYRQHGDVTLFKPVSDVPEFGQAKMIRFILASLLGGDVCYIDDIDLLPLRKDFITDKTNKREQGKMLCVGGEVYQGNGCYPISQMTAEGWLWKQLINPDKKSYRELMDEWKGETMMDRREDICLKLDWAKDDYFSDERLLRRLMKQHGIAKQEMERGYADYLEATIDRHTWNKKSEMWEYDILKLKNGGYVNAHGIRPFKKYEKHYKPLIDYINTTYP